MVVVVRLAVMLEEAVLLVSPEVLEESVEEVVLDPEDSPAQQEVAWVEEAGLEPLHSFP